ncbi:MAG: glycosyltransferase family 4 protein [Pseudolabrys sp.]
MHFAFAIVSMFPGGGLQRDCVDIAQRVRKLGHDVTIFTSRIIDDDFSKDLAIQILPNDRRTNHERQQKFSDDFLKAASGKFDLLVGFDKLSGLDMLYCSDRSMHARATRNPVLRLLPRYWKFIKLEEECFGRDKKTDILLLNESQLNEYWGAWTTEPNRLIMLPPTLVHKRHRPKYRIDGTREIWRNRLGLSANDWAWLSIGVQPRTKGFDRTIRALRQFPEARLLFAGLNEDDGKSAGIRRLAEKQGVASRIKWLGHIEEIPELMSAADLFVHPARYDTTGTVILEAIVNGLPVVTTSACGYSTHVRSADAGIVVQDPFHRKTLIAALQTARDAAFLVRWSKAGSEYGTQRSLYEGKNRATELIVARGLETSRAGAMA